MQSSKQFIIDRILEQARFEAISLNDIEIRMLKFTEATSASKDLETAETFERDYNDEDYEEKIANLIRHAYERDKQSGTQESWDNALIRVAGRDRYLNVMIDRSGIRNDSMGNLGDWRFFLYAVSPWALSLIVAALIGFSPIGSRLIGSDVLRLVITICILWTPYWVLRKSQRRSKTVRKTRPGMS